MLFFLIVSYSQSHQAGTERESRVVTPTIDVDDFDNSFDALAAKNESFVSLASGYEGDGESEGEGDSMECQGNAFCLRFSKKFFTTPSCKCPEAETFSQREITEIFKKKSLLTFNMF